MREETAQQLGRQLGVFGATMMGLGAIVGTGVFVSISVAADIAGPLVLLAIIGAAVVAACNALNSAQLAASHPVSGGTYEYGYKYLNSYLGFTAGWMFLCAKSASAATAALGLAGYLVSAAAAGKELIVPVAVFTVASLTLLTLAGIRRLSWVNTILVSITMTSLVLFCIAGASAAWSQRPLMARPMHSSEPGSPVAAVLQATALMFVAFTGYGRIATLGEEVKDPARTIPKAILATLIVATALYLAVGALLIGGAGREDAKHAAIGAVAPLQLAAARLGLTELKWVIAVGASTAMLGVLLNLILGLSRVLLAMGRRADLPAVVATVNKSGTTPPMSVLLAGTGIACLAMIGEIKTTWSFSAFTVLVYYAITNLAALHLQREQRLYPPSLSWIGLGACLFLAFWIEPRVWFVGVLLIGVGLVWRRAAIAIATKSQA